MNQSAYIEHDLRYRIASGKGVPDNLTLTSLARRYNVSITPVRSAITRLIAEGVLLKQSNGRLAVNPNKVGKGASSKVARRPLTPADWDQILIKEVMLTSLGPDAAYLREEALARKYRVGRSVIRQTFSRFAGAGLLEHVPRRGWLVRPFREENMRAYLEIREALELKALDLARPHIQREDLKKMLKGNPRLKKDIRPRLDNRLHRYLIEKSQNRYIREFFRQYISMYYTALFDYAAPEVSVVTQMARQHRRILKSLLSRAWARARQSLVEHIQAQGRILKKLLKR